MRWERASLNVDQDPQRLENVWDLWEEKRINGAISHRPERADGFCLLLHLCPTWDSLSSHLHVTGKEEACQCACGWELWLLLTPLLCYWMCCALPFSSCNLLNPYTEPYQTIQKKTLPVELKGLIWVWIFHMKEFLLFQTICIFLTCYWSDWTVLRSKAWW